MSEQADYINEQYDLGQYAPKKELSCRYCGARELHWKLVEGAGWRLHYSNGNIHTCDSYMLYS